MRNLALAAALAVAAAPLLASNADAKTIINGGDVNVEITYDLLSLDLWGSAGAGSPPAYINENGNPVVSFPIQMSRGEFYDRGSQSDEKGGFNLRLNGGVYLFPLGTSGDPSSELASFDAVKVFGEIPEGVDIPRSLRWTNYVDNGDGTYSNYANGEPVELTPEQAALLVDGEVRNCCRHTLNALSFDTVAGEIDGRIDGVRQRDINFDGVIDERDDFYLFDVLATADEGVFDLALTAVMASYLNYGFTPAAFPAGSAFAAWGGGPLNFQGGDVVGQLSYNVDTSVVPVPAALPLLASGLGLLGFMRSRRKKAA